MKPELVTAPRLRNVLAELSAREPVFHRPEFGTTRAEFGAMMDDAFREIGASGKRYSREFVLDVLEERARAPQTEHLETSDFHCIEIAAGNYLLTYTLRQADRVTRRASIWRKTNDGWKIVFHQGTIVA
jgi:hypothetical protein